MDSLETNLITLHNSAWNWHILAIILLSFSILFFRLGDSIFFLAFFFLFGLCEFKAWKRKVDLNLQEDLSNGGEGEKDE